MSAPGSTDSAHTAHLIELVLEVTGPVPLVEPLLRSLRGRLEAAGDDFARQVGAHASQEFGALTCTVRAVIDSADLLVATELALKGIRPVVASVLVGQEAVVVRETSVHVRVL